MDPPSATTYDTFIPYSDQDGAGHAAAVST